MNTNMKFEGRYSVALVALSFVALLAGCGHQTLTVRMANATAPSFPDGTPPAAVPATDPVPGVPFYVRRGVCKRETVWLEPQYKLTLVVTIDDQPPVSYTLLLSRNGYLSQPVQDLLKVLSGISGKYDAADVSGDACPDKIVGNWTAIGGDANDKVVDGLDQDPQRLADAETNHNILRVLNTAKIDSIVDYSHQYYMNARSPWIGTAQVDAKLASDGTLTEGSGQVDDETWSTILTTISSLVGDFTGASSTAATATSPTTATPAVIPLAETEQGEQAKNHPQPTCPGINGGQAPQHKIQYKFAVTMTIYEHDHKKQTFDLGLLCTPTTTGVRDGNVEVSVKSTDSGKKNPNAIEITGEVQLPDAKKGKPAGSDSSSSPQQ